MLWNRRDFLRASTVVSTIGLSGCVGDIFGNEVQDTDGDGVIDSEDYAPRDSEVQRRSDLVNQDSQSETPTPTPTETPTPTPTPTPAKHNIPPQPAARYTFEGTGSTIVDQTGNGHDGQLQGASRLTARSGTALQFGGNGHAAVASGDTLNPSDHGYTTAFWFRTNTIPQDQFKKRQALLVKRQGGQSIRWQFTLQGEQVRLGVRGSTDGQAVSSDSGFVDGEWHHAAGVRQSGSLVLYVDGEQQSQSEGTLGTVTPESPVYLGAQPEYPNPLYYEGQLDDVVIYNRALTEKEVQQLYRAQQP